MDYENDAEYQELVQARRDLLKRRKAEQDALDAEAAQDGPGFLSKLALGLGAGYSASQAGGNAGQMVNEIYEGNRKEEEARRQARIKAIEGVDGTLRGVTDLWKARSKTAADEAKELGRRKWEEERDKKKFDHEKEMAKAKTDAKAPEKAHEYASTLRKEYIGLPTTKATQDTSASIQRVRQSYDNPSAAGDLALIFNYMKMLDPGSTVREGEFANAQNAAGIPDRIKNQYNKLMSGERLGDDQRRDFATQAERQYQAQLNSQKTFMDQYTQLAGKYGVDPSQVLFEFPQPRSYEQPQQQGGGMNIGTQEATADAPPISFEQYRAMKRAGQLRWQR